MRSWLWLLLLATLGACHGRAAGTDAAAGGFRFSPRPNRAAEIHWQGWSPAAFERARAEHKPVLLSLAAVWCHWCHVLDETTLSDARVIATLNRDFVALRVDADQRPDVEQRYILGGWPTVAFLDDEGEILDGGTYVPPDNFLAMAERARKQYALPRGTPGRTQPPRDDDPTAPGALDGVVEGVTRALEQSADLQNGGFGRAPKFPNGEAVRLLLEVGEHELARQALDAMLKLEDPVEGGFYRYAMRADWTSPHYEKMLQGQADLIAAYAHGARALHEPRYAAAARRAVAYVARTLTATDGSFYASQDADEAYSALDEAARKTRPAPYVDRTLLVDRNARMIAALVSAAHDLADASLLAPAARAATAITALRTPSGAFYHCRRAPSFPDARPTPSPELPGLLADQAWAIVALLDLAAAQSQPVPAVARTALAEAVATLSDPRGGFYDIPLAAAAPGRLKHRDKPLETNAVMARALRLLGDPAAARRTLTPFAHSSPPEAAPYAREILHQ